MNFYRGEMMSLSLNCIGSHDRRHVDMFIRLAPAGAISSLSCRQPPNTVPSILRASTHLVFTEPRVGIMVATSTLSSSPLEYTLIGTPFSTFTRTIAIALVEKDIPFKQIKAPARSDVADEFHPFGYLPILVIPRPNGQDVHLREGPAIAQYLDRVVPNPSLDLDETDACVPEKMWEFVSLVVRFGRSWVEPGDESRHSNQSIFQVTQQLRPEWCSREWMVLMHASIQ